MLIKNGRRLLFFLSLLLSLSALFAIATAMVVPTTKTYTANNFDLDGDGKAEEIRIQFSQSDFDPDLYTTCTVTINDQLLSVDPGIYAQYLFPPRIVKISDGDKKKQIAIGHGMDNYLCTTFIALDDEKPRQIGVIPGVIKSKNFLDRPDLIEFSRQKSVIQTAIQSDILQSWYIKQQYAYAGDQLYLVDQDFYAAVTPHVVEVIQGFTVFCEKDRSSTQRHLKPGDKITLLGTDNYCWVKIKNGKDDTLWISMQPSKKGYSSLILDANTKESIGTGSEYINGLNFYD